MVADEVGIVFLEDSETDFEIAVHGIRQLAPDLACRRFETRRDLSAFAASDPGTPRLVVVDIRLPDGSGLEAIPALRSMEKFRNVPIVVFTSSSNPEHLRIARKAGAADYRVKPLDVREYIRTVQEFARSALT